MAGLSRDHAALRCVVPPRCAGYVAKAVGWPMFFVICMLVAIPSLILLAWLHRRGHFEALGPVRV